MLQSLGEKCYSENTNIWHWQTIIYNYLLVTCYLFETHLDPNHCQRWKKTSAGKCILRMRVCQKFGSVRVKNANMTKFHAWRI